MYSLTTFSLISGLGFQAKEKCSFLLASKPGLLDFFPIFVNLASTDTPYLGYLTNEQRSAEQKYSQNLGEI
jgi:hypothetical protein